MPRESRTDDEVIGNLLVLTWTIATGRTLPAGVPLAAHAAEVLITFWADDLMAETAGAAAAAPDPRRPADDQARAGAGREIPGGARSGQGVPL